MRDREKESEGGRKGGRERVHTSLSRGQIEPCLLMTRRSSLGLRGCEREGGRQ